MRTVRYNIYKRVHSRLRTRLMDAGLKMQSSDFGKAEQASETSEFLERVLDEFEKHTDEDLLIFHSVASLAPYIVSMLEKANEKNLHLAKRIREKIAYMEVLKSRVEKRNTGAEVQSLFFEFTATVLQNMVREENVVNELLWTIYTDKELAEMEAEILNSPCEEDIRIRNRQDISSMSNSDLVRWINRLFETTTPFIAGKLIRIVRSIVPPDRWENISRQLTFLKVAA